MGFRAQTKALSSELSREMGSKTGLLAWEMGSSEGDRYLWMGSPPAECYQLGSSMRCFPALQHPQGGGGMHPALAEVGGQCVGELLLLSASETHHGTVATLALGVQSVDLPGI